MTRQAATDIVARAKRSIARNPQFSRLLARFCERERFVAVLGAGCSMSCGIPSFEKLKWLLSAALTGAGFSKDLAKEVDSSNFDDIWDGAGPSTRHSVMSNWFLKRPSYLKDYYSLALLIQGGFLKTIITYNLDNYLELALHSVGFDDFLVLVNGVHEANVIEKLMRRQDRVVILKTHGDHHYETYALSSREMLQFGERIRPVICEQTSKKLLIIGYSASDSDFIRSLDVATTGDEVYFVNPNPPPPFLEAAMSNRASSKNWVRSDFSRFITLLYRAVQDMPHAGVLQRQRKSTKRREEIAEAIIEIRNRLGLHARAAAKFVRLATQFSSDVHVSRVDARSEIDAKSILGLLMLTAGPGCKLRITTVGRDAKQAMASLTALINDGFGED
jgi:phosphocarrier protein HPr